MGRAWQHLRWDAPWRVLLWDEKLLKGPLKSLFGLEWSDWVGAETDASISLFTQFMGGYFLLSALVALLLHQKYTPRVLNKIFEIILIIGGIFLFILALLYAKDRNWQFALLMEFSIQCSLTFLLIGFLLRPKASKSKKYLFFLKSLIAISFLGHGFYAVGWPFPQPSSFIEMTTEILPLTESVSYKFIQLMGVLDFVAAFLLFHPKTQNLALYYCIIWGIFTAVARLWAGFYWIIPMDSFSQWIHELLVRLPHGGLPLFVLVILQKDK